MMKGVSYGINDKEYGSYYHDDNKVKVVPIDGEKRTDIKP